MLTPTPNPFAGYHELQHCRNADARDRKGNRLNADHSAAVQWCANGLIEKMIGVGSFSTSDNFDRFLGRRLIDLNDYDLKSFRWFEARWDEFMEGRV